MKKGNLHKKFYIFFRLYIKLMFLILHFSNDTVCNIFLNNKNIYKDKRYNIK